MPCVSQTGNAGSKAKSDRPPTSQVMLILSLRLPGRRPASPACASPVHAGTAPRLLPGNASAWPRCGSVLSSWGARAALSTRDAGPGASCWRRPPLAAFVGVRAAAFSPRWADRPGARRWCRGRRNRDKESQGTQSGSECIYVLSEPREDGRGTGRAERAGRRVAACPRSTGRGRAAAAAALSPRSQCSRWQSRARLGSCCWRESHSAGRDVTRRCQGPGGWQLCCPPPGRLQSHWAPPPGTF